MNSKRKVAVLNAALLACAGWMGWSVYQGWQSSYAEAGVQQAGGSTLANRFTLPAERALTASGSQVIQRNPFSRDRNINVEEPAAAPAGPPPQLPVVIGTMRLRDHYEALMAENAQTASTSFKQVKVGDSYGGYKVVSVLDDEVVVDLNGEKTTINVYLSSSNVLRNSARTTPEPAPAAAIAPRVESSSAVSSSSPVQTAAAPAAGVTQLPSPDPLLKITIEGNRRRYERTTMFGPQVWYEDIK
jgi:hypothetical protein